MLRYVVFLLLSCLVVFCITIYFRLGAHKSVEIKVAEVSPLGVAVTEHIGPYHEVNASIQKVEQWARETNLPCPRTVGIYLDDPALIEETRLRSQVGCVLDGVSSLTMTTPPPDWLQVKALATGRHVVATFEGAPSIGPLKVYPAVEKFFEAQRLKKAGPPVEIYKVNGTFEAVTEYRFLVE